MNPEVLELPGTILLMIAAYATWRSCKPRNEARRNKRDGRRREVWDEVEGRVISVRSADSCVLVAYEFLTPAGSQNSEQRFVLEKGQNAEQHLRLYTVGSAVRVRFNPKCVTESVLSRPRFQAAPAVSEVAESPAF